MDKLDDWYVLQTLSGSEMKVQSSIEKRLAQEELDELIHRVLVPMERVTEVKMGRKMTINRKFYPGYIFVQIELYQGDGKINDRVWSFLNETDGIIGFVGGDHPAPLSPDEIQDIMDQLERGDEDARPRIEFEIGEVVKIRDGAFENLEGKIESIDSDRGRLHLSVSIFGRSTQMEVEYWQVERE